MDGELSTGGAPWLVNGGTGIEVERAQCVDDLRWRQPDIGGSPVGALMGGEAHAAPRSRVPCGSGGAFSVLMAATDGIQIRSHSVDHPQVQVRWSFHHVHVGRWSP